MSAETRPKLPDDASTDPTVPLHSDMCCKKRNKPSDDLLTEMAAGKDSESTPRPLLSRPGSVTDFPSRFNLRRAFAEEEEAKLAPPSTFNGRGVDYYRVSGSSDDDSKKRR
jgi:hypothetical protein